jgi:hypothetical protein
MDGRERKHYKILLRYAETKTISKNPDRFVSGSLEYSNFKIPILGISNVEFFTVLA